MKAPVFMFLLAMATNETGLVWGQVSSNAPSSSPSLTATASSTTTTTTSSTITATAAAPPAPAPLDPATIAEYQQRFEQGYDLEQQGKLDQARGVYDGILAEQPDAKRSLLEAGRVSLQLNQPARADVYLEKLHALVPDFPEAYELLIQANQALKKDIKTERLVREYRQLRDSGRVSGFDETTANRFVRERLQLDQGEEVAINQFFDYTQPPNYALEVDYYGAGHTLKRMLLLKYDPDATTALRAKDPAHATSTVFILAEPIFSGGRTVRIDVYQELLVVPEYARARNLLLGDLAQAPKPIYSQAVGPSADPAAGQ